MLKKLVIATAAAGLMTSAAFAQTPSTNSPTTPPAATMPAPSMSQKFVSMQTSDQWLASRFIGTDVIGTDNQKIGDVSNVLFDKDGKILAYVVGVGGFLGIGSKDVALEPTAFELLPANDRDDAKLKLSMSKDDLKNAAEFKAYERPRTVGAAPGGMNRAPAGGMTPPAPPAPPAPSPTR